MGAIDIVVGEDRETRGTRDELLRKIERKRKDSEKGIQRTETNGVVAGGSSLSNFREDEI